MSFSMLEIVCSLGSPISPRSDAIPYITPTEDISKISFAEKIRLRLLGVVCTFNLLSSEIPSIFPSVKTLGASW